MMMNLLLRRINQRNRTYIKDIIESVLPNREMKKLLIMVDIRLCTNVITKLIEMREVVEELCKLMILMVQTLILMMDLSTKDHLLDQMDMIINSQLEKKQDLTISHNQFKKKQDLMTTSLCMLQSSTIIEMEADSMEDKIKR